MDPPPERGRLPAGTVTFLFSDLQGSTGLLQSLGEGYAEVLLRQRAMLRAAIAAAGGREIDVAGDGLFAAFDRARDAVAAAIDAQRALAAHAWPAGASVRLRMGLHTGEPAATAGQYVGLDVHRAARICAAAHGGQALLSETTCRLVENSLPAAVTLRDLGAHSLKDLPQAEHLFQLVIPGLPDEFPPLRTATRAAGNLPLQPNAFVGREDETAAVRRLVLQEDVRLLTLTGPGGIGKTRLALQVASGVKDAFPDGIWFVPLAAITDPMLLAASIAKALGIRESPARPLLEQLQDDLRHRHLLLLLDNFEQLLAAGPDLGRLLAACPGAKALVTSRVLLRLGNEQAYDVPPLSLPADDAPAAQLAQSSAVALFVQRARAVKPAFALAEETAPIVARICARLDGLPLAIELAAARVRILSLPAILARLGSRLALLTGGARDAPERHQTLRQAIAWSYDLLEDEERRFFRRLSVFVGGWTLDAAEEVCGGSGGGPPGVPLETMAALADKSLVRQLEGGEEEPRFGMLETIREFGLEQLEAAGDRDTARRVHAACFLRLAERAAPELTGPEQRRWLDRLEAEHDNLRAALGWAQEQPDAETGLRLGAALWRFWTVRGHLREGRRWLHRLLALPEAQARTRARARALQGLGTMMHEISDYADARPCLEESLAISQELGDSADTIAALNSLGWLAFQQGDFDRSSARSEEALARSRAAGERRGTALALHALGLVAFERGAYATGVSRVQESLALREAIGDRRGAAYQRINLAWLEQRRGNPEGALRLLEEALGVLRALHDQQLVAWALSMQGMTACSIGRLHAAQMALDESLRLARDVGNKAIVAWALTHLGNTRLRQGATAEAATHLEEAVAIAREIRTIWCLPEALLALGDAVRAAGDRSRALALYRESVDLCTTLGAHSRVPAGLAAMATLLLEAGDAVASAELLGARERITQQMGVPSDAGRTAAIESARCALGEEAFQRSWERGRHARLEDVCQGRSA